MKNLRHIGAFPWSFWLAVLETNSVQEWMKRDSWLRYGVGRQRFSKAKAIALQIKPQIIEEINGQYAKRNADAIQKLVDKAHAEIYAMSVKALQNVEQRAHDDAMAILSPSPKDYPKRLTYSDGYQGKDSARAFMAKVAHGVYNHAGKP